MRTDKLETTIQDLRRIEEKEPNTAIHNAIVYLDLFLEKLLTKELPPSYISAGTLHHRMVCPLPEWESFQDQVMVKICSDFEVKIDELLENYEEAYGLEPVTYEEMDAAFEAYCNCAKYMHGKDQVRFFGWKYYKKKVRDEN